MWETLRRCRFDPWAGKIPWRRKWQPTPVFLAGEFHGLRSLVGCTPLGHKESDMTEQLSARFGKPLANSQGEKTLWGKHTPTHSPKHFFQTFVVLFQALLYILQMRLEYVCFWPDLKLSSNNTVSLRFVLPSPNPHCLMPLKKKEKPLIPKAWIPNSAGALLQDTKLLYCGHLWSHGVPYSWGMDTTSAIERTLKWDWAKWTTSHPKARRVI